MEIEELEKIAREIRKDIIRLIATAGSGHTAGSLGTADLFTAFYFEIMQHDPKTPNWDRRDRLIVSCGHVCPAQYAAMARAGYFPSKELKSYCRFGSGLQGHPERGRLPGIETTSGPLGCGLAQAAGIALGARLDNKRFRVYCLTSDGENDSGNHWEAVAFVAKYKLANLTLFIDRNYIQVDGITEEVLPLDPLDDKYRAYNWNVIEIDGHSFEEISLAVRNARDEYQRPTVIIARTVPGKGVSFLENDYRWHAKAPNRKEVEVALKELK